MTSPPTPPDPLAALAPLREPLLKALQQGHVVLSAPTGSGKSTRVPLWIAAQGARVLVVEPRRVACRALYRHLSQQRRDRSRGDSPSPRVGYVVRHEQESPDAQVLFVTPGVAVRLLGEAAGQRFDVVVLDEFHERRMDVDLLLAVLRRDTGGRAKADPQVEERSRTDARTRRVVVLSATLDVHRVAGYLGGTPLSAQARTYPVTIQYAEAPDLPTTRDLAPRVLSGVREAIATVPEGDVLVFLPGKGEIRDAEALLPSRLDVPVVPLHGALDRHAQDRAFETGDGRKVVLATNVAESSVTLPGVRAVVDSGLERRTTYRRARSVLSLHPISVQSADQRAGRAGRLGPGVAIRLWSRRAVLRAETPPEILREDLDPLLLLAASLKAAIPELEWLDRPDPKAVDRAHARLVRLGLLNAEASLTPLGREAVRLPVDPPLARLLLEARAAATEGPEGTALLGSAVDLVATLAAPAPFWHVTDPARLPGDAGSQKRGRRRRPRKESTAVSVEQSPCDASLRIELLRQGRAPGVEPRPYALAEARRIARQLWHLVGQTAPDAPAGAERPGASRKPPAAPNRRRPRSGAAPDRLELARLALRADPDAAFVRRGSRFAGAGLEASLGSSSRVAPGVEALVVLETHSERSRGMRATHQITCAIPVSRSWLVRQGVGVSEVARVRRAGEQLVGRVRVTLAGVLLAEQEQPLTGPQAVTGAAQLILQGSLFRGLLPRLEERLRLLAIHFAEHGETAPPVPLDLPAWLTHRLAELGLESGADLPLLEADDLLPAVVPPEALEDTQARFPATVRLPDRTCEARYDFKRRKVELVHRSGNSQTPPAPSALPPLWHGWRVIYRVHSRQYTLR